MENEKNTKLKGNAVKIIIPVIIACLVFAVWAFKSHETDKKSDVPAATGNPDFALNADDSFDLEKLKSYGLPIIIDFGAGFCQPCIELEPIIKELNSELQGKAVIKYVDVEKYKKIAGNFPISAIPTQILIDSSGNPYKPKDESAFGFKFYKSSETDELAFTAHEGGMSKDMFVSILKEMGMR